MSTVIHKPITPGEYSNKDLQKASFRDEDLSGVDFSGSDLRGANLSGSNLIGANFSNVRTGIPTHDCCVVISCIIGRFSVRRAILPCLQVVLSREC